MREFAGLPVADAGDVGMDQAHLDRIDDVMSTAVADGKLPGAVTVVARKGKVVHSNAVGSLDIDAQDGQLGMNSLFRMYSQSKPVTAVATMSLYEDGLLFLDDPIKKWLPEFADPRVTAYAQASERVKGTPIELGGSVAANRDLTIFDLMTMTSGMPGMSRTPVNYFPLMNIVMNGTGFQAWDQRVNDPDYSYEEMVLALSQVPLHTQPGEVWNYGSDFDVLTLLLTRATDMSLDELLAERVFEPLGMTDSFFYCGEENVDRLVTDHAWDQEGNVIVRDPPATAEKVGRSNRQLMSGNGMFGGILSTPYDFTRFAQMLLNGGSLDGKRVLGRKTVELMTTNHIGDRSVDIAIGPGYGFGLGYAVRKSLAGSNMPGSIGTYGWGGAAGTWFFVDPKEELFGLFFTHIFGYQFSPEADHMFRFEKLAYEALN